MVQGRLDPAQYAQWVHQRVQFLSQIPNAAAMFGTIEAAQHTIQAVLARSGAVANQQSLSLRRKPAPPPFSGMN